ncbi:hypothetical protein CYMTET_18596 [Cymbomonas tetramitiformis]|uniref:Uncharacterized protein n=1 Tax=Cymbomonas tetramitiformis TaxID=36881 RepID=A0AAE0L605_9CHLO|nr:hypothetical protein CYMTET_18596 [Cymbomonas tetramitiformis]
MPNVSTRAGSWGMVGRSPLPKPKDHHCLEGLPPQSGQLAGAHSLVLPCNSTLARLLLQGRSLAAGSSPSSAARVTLASPSSAGDST